MGASEQTPVMPAQEGGLPLGAVQSSRPGPAAAEIVLRRFAASVEKTAQEWFEQIETAETWLVTPTSVRGGEANGFFAKARDGKSAYAKPGKTPALHPTLPRAAIEKIASDLAFAIGLPVPPAVLWHRENAKKGEARRCCLSLVPFKPAHEWKAVKLNPKMEARLLPELVDAASGMAVLDTWLDNKDRGNHRNLLVALDKDGVGVEVVRCAYLDFSFSMSGPWNSKMESDQPVACCPPGVVPNMEAARAIIARVEALDWTTVEKIVHRIPDAYMPQADRDLIVNTLKARRATLRTIMAKSLAGLA